MKEGLYFDESFEDYLSIDALNASSLKTMLDSPKAYRYAKDNPDRKPSPAMQFGTLVHTALLEPDRYEDEVIISLAKSKTAKMYKDEVKDNPGKTVITATESGKLENIRYSVNQHKDLSRMLRLSKPEVNMIWNQYHNVQCKGRLDALLIDGDNHYIIDLKTTSANSFHSWKYEAQWKYHYNLQAAFYSMGYEKLTEVKPKFIFAVVQTVAPYDVWVVECTNFFLDEGAVKCLNVLETYLTCLKTNTWPGQVPDVGALEASDYYFQQLLQAEKEKKHA